MAKMSKTLAGVPRTVAGHPDTRSSRIGYL
jgi:hypothetical protein